MTRHPILPNHRPLAIAHRAGNTIAAAAEAIRLGVDMLEADVWPFLGRLEVRHAKTLGPLPIYWEKWYIESVGGRPPRLEDILRGTPSSARLFLDLKGHQPQLGQRVVSLIQRVQPERDIIICGRAWRQLDRIADTPNVHVFYSVGEESELAKVWSHLERVSQPAISINHGLLTEETLARLRELNTTVIAWTVNDSDLAATLFERGVDGFTSDNLQMLGRIVARRERAFAGKTEVELPEQPEAVSKD